MIYKRGRIYWFNFVYNGEHIQKSTKVMLKSPAMLKPLRDCASSKASLVLSARRSFPAPR